MYFNKTLCAGLAFSLLLTTTFLNPAQGQEKTFQPQGKWALTKVDRVSTNGNSYCTLSQKYDQNVVLSLGRNIAEEYSLAFDFQKTTFQKDDALKITLQPGQGKLRAYNLMPASDQALVIRLGWDKEFFTALNQTQSLKLNVDDIAYDFKLSDIAQGQKDLANCMGELKASVAKTKPDNRVAGSNQTKDVLNASAENASDKFALNKTGETIKPVAVSNDKIELAKVETDVVKSKNFGVNSNAQTEKKVNLAPALTPKPASNEVKIAMVETPTATKMTMLPEITKTPLQAAKPVEVIKPFVQTAAIEKPLPNIVEIQERKSLAPVSKEQVAVKPASPIASKPLVQQAVVEKPVPKIVAFEERKSIALPSKEIVAAKAEASVISKEAPVISKPVAEKEIADAAPKAIIPAKADRPVVTAPSPSKMQDNSLELAALRTDNKSLMQKIDALEKTIDEATKKSTLDANAKAQRDVSQKNMDTKNIASMEARLKELEIRNAQLEDTLRQSQTRIAETAVNTETKSFKQIADLELKLKAAQQDNLKLASEMDSIRLQKEDKSLSLVAGDWDLEKATKRFNESERENQRLGLQLEKERTSCNMEKKQIETMLFDPAVTEQKQIEKLAALEQELDLLKNKSPNAGLNANIRKDQQTIASWNAEKIELLNKTKTLEAALMLEQNSAGNASYQTAAKFPRNDTSPQLNDALKQNAELRDIVANLQSDLISVQATTGGRVEQSVALQRQVDDLKKQTALKDAQNATYQNQLALTQRDNQALEGALAQKKVSVVSAQALSPETAMSNITPAAGVTSKPIMRDTKKAKPLSGADLVKAALEKSGAGLTGFSSVSNGMAGAENFTWGAGQDLKGFAAVKTAQPQKFDDNIAQYIDHQKSLCSGDFASMPSPSYGSAAMKMSLYEVACVGTSQSTSASLLFYEDDGKFVAISNQTDAANMDIAMDGRDKIAQSVRGL